VSAQAGVSQLSGIAQVANQLHVGQIYLVVGQRSTLRVALDELVGRYAIHRPICVIVGGNSISFERLPYLLKGQAYRYYEIMNRIMISRAETCHQILDAIRRISSAPSPVVITDFLEPFRDEDLIDAEVEQVFADTLQGIRELSANHPVLISASSGAVRNHLLGQLEHTASTRLYFKATESGADLQSNFYESL
jgi:archaellum biogenesis ATPase FlaH